MSKSGPKVRSPESVYIRPDQHVRTLNPPPGLGEPIVPNDYFVTTGEAVMKARQIVKDVTKHRDSLLCHPPTPEVTAYGRQVVAALSEAVAFVDELLRLRGVWLWLECWKEGELVHCQCKTSKVVGRPRKA